MDERTVTRRSRNLGFAWTNQPVQKYGPTGQGYLGFRHPDRPHVVGGPRAVREEFYRATRLNRGNYWRCDLFVGGRRVAAVDGQTVDTVAQLIGSLEDLGEATVVLAPEDEQA